MQILASAVGSLSSIQMRMPERHAALRMTGMVERMIKNNLRVLMAIQKMRMTELSKLSGVGYRTIVGLYHEKITRIEFETLNKLCNALECTPNDLLIYTPDE